MDALATEIRTRGEWAEAMRKLGDETTARLVDLMEQDYRHQTGIRGCSEEAGIEEMRCTFRRWTEQVIENAEAKLAERLW